MRPIIALNLERFHGERRALSTGHHQGHRRFAFDARHVGDTDTPDGVGPKPNSIVTVDGHPLADERLAVLAPDLGHDPAHGLARLVGPPLASLPVHGDRLVGGVEEAHVSDREGHRASDQVVGI
ncbi:hypothetical protein D3C72_1586700 [compost metagenome]